MLCTTFCDCCVPRGTSQIPVLFFMVPLIFSSLLLWTDISCLSCVMVHPPSYDTPNDINGAVWIFGKMWICLACFLRHGSWSVAMCADSIVLPSGSLDFISFSIIKGDIVGMAFFAMCLFAPKFAISRNLVLVGLGGVSI